VRQKVLLEAYRYKGVEALEDGIVDAVAPPEKMLDVALKLAEKWKSKSKMGVYGVLRNELVGEATKACKTAKPL
jgi:enoyl-CoA hydratase/carnithine racemase